MFESGMEILRADFHLHTKADKEFKYNGEENSYINNYIDELFAQGIRVAVLTNHNKFDMEEYKALKRKAAKKDILILPGVELSVKEGSNGVHTLIIFDPDSWIENGNNHIASFLSGAFAGISNYESENAKCKYDLHTVISELDAYGKDYFIIFAHVEQKSGLLSECSGGLLQSLVSQIPNFRDRVLGIQKMRTRDKINNLNQWLGYLPSFVEGSDPKQISEIGKGDHVYIKIGALTYAAVKFALQDSQNRVFTNLPSYHHGYIESISFTGGKLDGKTINFSPELNTLIGIRGSGKSSILETSRYVFDISPQTDTEYKNGVVKNIMGSGGVVQVSVIDKTGHRYFVRRIYGQRPSVLDENDNDLPITPQALLGTLLYFGQKDLSSSSDHENELLQRIVGSAIPDQSGALADIQREMSDTVRILLDAEEIPNQISEVNSKIQETKHKIRLFEEKGVTDKLEKQLCFNKDLQQLGKLQERLQLFLDKLKTSTVYQNSEEDFKTYFSKYNSQRMDQAKTQLSLFLGVIGDIQKKCESLSTILSAIKTIHGEIQKDIEGLQEEFAAIKREIADETLDPDVCVKLSETLSELETRLEKLNESLGSRKMTTDRLRTFVRKRNELLLESFTALSKETQMINEAQSNIRIAVEFKGAKGAFKDLLKNKFRGSNISDSKYQIMSERFSDFVDVIADWLLDDGKILREFLTPNEYSKVEDKLKSLYSELILLDTDNKVDIFYHDKLLRQHSIGQRASALILFILTHNDTDVIIIDQPEDDLDNKVIYDEVLKVIRAMKMNTQFIFATHNANIPVLGDAEMILAADSDGESITYQSGNIDTRDSQQQIITIMEGGTEAFARRRLIYSSWSNQ